MRVTPPVFLSEHDSTSIMSKTREISPDVGSWPTTWTFRLHQHQHMCSALKLFGTLMMWEMFWRRFFFFFSASTRQNQRSDHWFDRRISKCISQIYIFCEATQRFLIVWLRSKEFFFSHGRVQFGCAEASLQQLEFSHRLLYTSKGSPYIQVLTVSHRQLFESITGSVVCEWHLSLWNSHLAVSDRGPLILKTDRHRGVQGRRGWRGLQRGHTQDRTGFSNSTRWRQQMNARGLVLMGFIAESLCFLMHTLRKPQWKCWKRYVQISSQPWELWHQKRWLCTSS